MEIDVFYRYNGIIKTPYKAELIDNLSVKSLFSDKLEDCEHWGWNDEGENGFPFFDFGKLCDFLDFEIGKNYCRFYSGIGLEFISLTTNPSELNFSAPYCPFPFENISFRIGYNPELIINKVPETMEELGEMIAGFIQSIKDHFEKAKSEHEKNN